MNVEVSDIARNAERTAAEVLARVSVPAPQPIMTTDVLADKVMGRDPVLLGSDFAKTLLEDLLRAQRIADDAARSTVELECLMCDAAGMPFERGASQAAVPWYDTRKVNCRFAMPMLIEALIYLDKRGLLHRDMQKRYLVRFDTPATPAASQTLR